MNFNVIVDANVEYVRRVSTRFAEAATAAQNGTYAPQQLFRDAFASFVSDPLQWTGTLLRAVVAEPAPAASAAPPTPAGGGPKSN
jgi:hypothetical protein